MYGSRYERSFSKKVAAKRVARATYKNKKGDYPYTWNDEIVIAQKKGIDPAGAQKVKLSPTATSVDKLDIMRDKHIPEINLLVAKYEEFEKEFKFLPKKIGKKSKQMTLEKFMVKKFRKVDLMKITHYRETIEKIQREDLEKLTDYGLIHKPVTAVCKTIKLLELLKKFHLESKPNKSLEIYLRLMEKSFKDVLVKHPNLVENYTRSIDWMNTYAGTQNLVKYQIVTKHEIMPPLNVKGFVELDKWQEDAIDLMRDHKSAILSIPTSGGKTYLSAYLTKSKGKIWFIAPSVPLARQVSAYLTRVAGFDVPYLTDTYRPQLYHTSMLDLLERSKIIVSTPDILLDYVPEISGLGDEDNLIIDEIHMMGSNQGDSMEIIALLNQNALLLGLSATVSNPEDLISWRKKAGGDDLSIISSNKRFFNLQTAYWDKTSKSIINLNPLSMVSLDDFTSGIVLMKDMKPTPPDVYELAEKIETEFGDEMGNLRLADHFSDLISRRVTLMEVLDYFTLLLKFMVSQCKTSNVSKIDTIVSSFVPADLEEEETDLLEIITYLRDTKNTPVLVFERNTYSLMRLARKLIEDIDREEDLANPERIKEHEKLEKEAKKRQRDMEKAGLIAKSDCGLSDGKSSKDKAELGKIERMKDKSGLEEIIVEHIQKPTAKYNWSHQIPISHSEIAELEIKLKKYFPRNGDFYHPIIHALWRGIGIYAEGLPDDYLVTVQVMANEKKLGVVLSDKSMTFGVSMPFRNVVIYRDQTTVDELNPLLFKQMEGRAGRRGQDTKGNVIFAGYSWKRIEELSVSQIPKIEGQDSVENIYLPVGAKLAQVSGKSYDFKKIMTSNLSRQQSDSDKEYSTWEEYQEMWKTWAPEAMAGDVAKLRVLWQSRNYGCDGIAFYHLVDALEKQFSGNDISEKQQVEAGKIMSFFIQNKKAKTTSTILSKPYNYDNTFKLIRHKLLEMGIPLEDEDCLDNRVWVSIRNNSLVAGSNDKEYQEIRENFFKFASSLKVLQNYCYYSRRITLAKILGKLFTRCKWIIWSSSPLINFGKEQTYIFVDDDELIPKSDDEEHTEEYYGETDPTEEYYGGGAAAGEYYGGGAIGEYYG